MFHAGRYRQRGHRQKRVVRVQILLAGVLVPLLEKVDVLVPHGDDSRGAVLAERRPTARRDIDS